MRKLVFVLLVILFYTQGHSQLPQTKIIDSLYVRYNHQKQAVKKVDLLYTIGLEYLGTNLDSSLSILNTVKYRASKIKSDTLLIKTQIALGRAHTNKTALDSAKIYFDLAKNQLGNKNYSELHKSLHINLVILFFHKADYVTARKEFELVLKLALKENNLTDLSRCYNNIALCRNYTGNYTEALKMNLKSAEIEEKLNNKIGLAKSYNNIGLVYFDLNDYSKSEEYLLKSLEIKKTVGNNIDIIGSYLNVGNIHRKMAAKQNDISKFIKAKNYYSEALKLSEKTNYEIGKDIAYTSLALVETNLGNYIKSIEYGNKSLQINLRNKDSKNEMITRINLGDAYRYNKQYQEAEKHLFSGLAIAKKIGDINTEKEAFLILSLLYGDTKKFENALTYYKSYTLLKDSISSSDVKNKVNELETKYQTEKKQKEILSQRVDISKKEQNLHQKNIQLAGLGILAILLSILGYLLYNQQKLKNKQQEKEYQLQSAIKKIETQNQLFQQRLAISRDLHDNIGAQLTFIISSVNNLKYGISNKGQKIESQLNTINNFTKATITELRDTVWAMNSESFTMEDLKLRILNFIEKAEESSHSLKIQFSIQSSLASLKFGSIKGINVYRVIQEAVNNALKYAHATEMNIEANVVNDTIEILIKDNGKGFDIEVVNLGNGILNMQKRMETIYGEFKLSSTENGTQIMLVLPLKQTL